MHTLVPLWSRPASIDSSSWVPQKCLAIQGIHCLCSGQPLRVRQYMVLYTRSHSIEPRMMSSSALDSCTSWTFCTMEMGRQLLWEGKQLMQLANKIHCQAYTGWCSHTSACTEASSEAWGELCGWAFAGSFPEACGHSAHACHRCRYGTSQDQRLLTDTLAQCLHSKS